MNDEVFYEAAIDELECGSPHRGQWTRALLCAGGDESTAPLIYVELRKEQLMADVAAKAATADRGRIRLGYWTLAVAVFVGAALGAFALDACAP
jgi:hypothetical protein